MSALTESTTQDLISIVAWAIERTGKSPATAREIAARSIAQHEAETRAAVVADIEDLEHTRQQVREGVRRGHTVDYYEGYDHGIAHAARIAEGEQ